MATTTIDLTNFKDRIGSRIDPGTYRVAVEDVEMSTSNAGNPMIVLYFRVQDGEHEGATLVDRLAQTEKALFKTVNFMQAMGLPTPRKKIRLDLNKLVGRQLSVEVDDSEPYRGNVRSEVRGYLKLRRAGEESNGDGTTDLDGLGEFAPESTSNPTEAAVQDTLPEAAAAPETNGAASPEPEPTPEPQQPAEVPAGPQEIDIDSIEL